MAENKTRRDPLPEAFDTFEEMAEFWETHDITDYDEYLTPVEVEIATHPRREYIITLSDTLNESLRRIQQQEGVSLSTLVNLWVQEKLQGYAS